MLILTIFFCFITETKNISVRALELADNVAGVTADLDPPENEHSFD